MRKSHFLQCKWILFTSKCFGYKNILMNKKKQSEHFQRKQTQGFNFCYVYGLMCFVLFLKILKIPAVYIHSPKRERGRFNWSQPFRLGLYWLFEFLFILYWIKYQLIKTIILNMNKKWEKQILLFRYNNSSLKYESSSSHGISPFYPTPNANSSQRARRINLPYFKTIS